jgi:hypothetical protein
VVNTQGSFISEEGGDQNLPSNRPQNRNKASIDFDNKHLDVSQMTNRSKHKTKKLDTRIDAVEMSNIGSYFSQSKVIFKYNDRLFCPIKYIYLYA